MNKNNIINAFMQEIKDIRFYCVDDFMNKKEKIRDKVMLFDVETKEIYKWYFYHQLCCLPQKQFYLKDLMWLYAVGENVDFELSLQYRLFCEKRSKINYDV